MKLTVDAKAFGAALAIAGRVIPTKTPWPVIMNIHLRAEGTSVTLRGTNADTTYEADVAAEVEMPGEAVIPFATLAKFFSAAKGDSLSIEIEDSKATVKCGRGRIVLSSMSGADFPNYAAASGDLVSLDGETFLKALRFCSAAVMPSELKYHIAGVNISEADGWLDLWGTDGKIAHHAKLVGVSHVGGGGQLTLDAIAVIASIADKADAVSFMICETGWHLNVGSVRAWGKVIDARYPDMERALSAFGDWENVANAEAGDVAQALDVAICGADTNSDKTRHIVLRCTDKMALRGYKPGFGTITAGRVEVDAEINAETAIALNADYLRASLLGIGGGVSISRSGDALRVEPRQLSATLPVEATIFAIRASEAELADV